MVPVHEDQRRGKIQDGGERDPAPRLRTLPTDGNCEKGPGHNLDKTLDGQVRYVVGRGNRAPDDEAEDEKPHAPGHHAVGGPPNGRDVRGRGADSEHGSKHREDEGHTKDKGWKDQVPVVKVTWRLQEKLLNLGSRQRELHREPHPGDCSVFRPKHSGVMNKPPLWGPHAIPRSAAPLLAVSTLPPAARMSLRAALCFPEVGVVVGRPHTEEGWIVRHRTCAGGEVPALHGAGLWVADQKRGSDRKREGCRDGFVHARRMRGVWVAPRAPNDPEIGHARTKNVFSNAPVPCQHRLEPVVPVGASSVPTRKSCNRCHPRPSNP
mmetsp:Transcript_8853/g.23090  ORF Transcript_8853/g.23090 Transcript_8853/m.23090 type:complete len:322 (+) Transcript_8853:238-1203(+)